MAFWEANDRLRPAAARSLSAVRNSLTWRHAVFALTIAVYVALTIAVIAGSPLDSLDQKVAVLDLHDRYPGWNRFVLDYVMFGQRGPSTFLALPWFVWVCYRRRTVAPLIRLGAALFLLNLSVGVVKVTTGRYGPLVTAHAHDVLAGGNIFPSGHTANAVVLYGVMAMTATRHRKLMTVAAVWISATVGLSTLYLDTHWFTDVLGGWLAGALVLMVLPTFLPPAQRAFDWTLAGGKRLLARRASRSVRGRSLGRPAAGDEPDLGAWARLYPQDRNKIAG
ncbi:MAG: phosphatase PAP2 family protein [Jatrophihabitantaceae bacterium]